MVHYEASYCLWQLAFVIFQERFLESRQNIHLVILSTKVEAVNVYPPISISHPFLVASTGEGKAVSSYKREPSGKEM